MKAFLNNILNKKSPSKHSSTANAEGYPEYLEEAKKLNIDINDYLDNNLGWVKPAPVLKEVLFPVLETISQPKILELGPGTGRWTRHILDKVKKQDSKEYTLVDHSQWMIDFLNSYFNEESILRIKKNNGTSLPPDDSCIDLIFSQGVFIELKPSLIYLYCKEFARVLKPGGFCVFDYFNFDSDEGWNYFINESDKGNIYYTFYSDTFIGKIFEMAGFTLEKKFTYGKAVFIVFKKK